MTILVGVGITWLLYSQQDETNTKASLFERYRWPAGFVVLLFAGWFVFGGLTMDAAADQLAAAQAEEQLEEDLVEVEVRAVPAGFGKFGSSMSQLGLALSPIVVLVLIVVGLSRLPFAR